MDFSCPHCGQALEIPESRRGALVRCPVCRGEYHAVDRLADRGRVSESPVTPTRASEPIASTPPVIMADPVDPFGKSKSSGGSGALKVAKVLAFVAFFLVVKGGRFFFNDGPAKQPPPRPVPVPVQPAPIQGWPPIPVGKPISPPIPVAPAEANDNPPGEFNPEGAPTRPPQDPIPLPKAKS